MAENVSSIRKIIDIFRTNEDVVISNSQPGISKKAIKEFENFRVDDMMEKRFIIFSPTATIKDVIKVFTEKNLSEAVVVEVGKLMGVITHRDILHLIEQVNLDHQKFSDENEFKKKMKGAIETQIGKILKSKVYVFPSISLFDAVIKMDENNLTVLPVVDENGYIIGIVKEKDIIEGVLNFLSQ